MMNPSTRARSRLVERAPIGGVRAGTSGRVLALRDGWAIFLAANRALE